MENFFYFKDKFFLNDDIDFIFCRGKSMYVYFLKLLICVLFLLLLIFIFSFGCEIILRGEFNFFLLLVLLLLFFVFGNRLKR